MDTARENQRTTPLIWMLMLFSAVLLIFVGYKSPTVWLSISVAACAGYIAARLTLPLFVAATQNIRLAKIANRTISFLGNSAVAAIISAPLVVLRWCGII